MSAFVSSKTPEAKARRQMDAMLKASGWPVQLLPPTGALVEEALQEAVVRDVECIPARVCTAEHLAAVALQTGRAKDKARLLQFVETSALDAPRFQDILSRHGLLPAWQRFGKQFLSDAP